jgi:serine/threonine protein kinase
MTTNPPSVSNQFDDFTLIRLLGEGTYGKVWAVTDPSGRYFAMKILNDNQSLA